MIRPFAVWRVVSWCVTFMVGVVRTGRATTAGRRDKRRGTPARYVVVVDRVFAHSIECHSAAHRRNAKHSAKVNGTIAQTLGFSS